MCYLSVAERPGMIVLPECGREAGVDCMCYLSVAERPGMTVLPECGREAGDDCVT